MTISGPGTFFDGVTSAKHAVTVELAADVLRARAADGTVLAEWRYDELETVPAPEGMLRLGQAGSPVLARLEVRDRGWPTRSTTVAPRGSQRARRAAQADQGRSSGA